MIDAISNINIKLNDEIISVSNENLKKFYIANLDDEGNEINYFYNNDSNNLFANFLILKIKKEAYNLIDKLLNYKCITNISINFINGDELGFELPKKRIINYGEIANTYEEVSTNDEDDLCILISDLDLKNKKQLFV